MKYTKQISLVLIVILLVVGLSADVSSAEKFVPGVNLERAGRTLSPDAVMISAGDGLEVTWGEFYFLLFDVYMENIGQYVGGFIEEIDWSEETRVGETLAETVRQAAIEQAELQLVFRYAANQLGITLSDEDIADIDDYINSILAEYDDEKILTKELQQNGYISLDVFRDFIKFGELQAKLPAELYGPYYSEIDDSVVEEYVERNEYMNAKHILLMFPSEFDGASEDVIETGKKDTLKRAEDLLKQLQARQKDADFEQFFSEKMHEHSEDGGLVSFPDGYLFMSHEMLEEFSDACAKLKPGEMSGLVETMWGYHIILRLPIDFDAIPYYYMSQGQYLSLRFLAIIDDFDKRVEQWQEEINFEHTKHLNSLDVSKVFAWRG